MIKSLFLKSLPYLLIVGCFVTGYLGFTHMQDKLNTFASKNKGLEILVESVKVENEVLKNDIEKWVDKQNDLETLIVNLQNANTEASKERERLNEIFQNHNLEKLAKAKPNLVEKRVNAGSSRLIRMFECATDPTCNNNIKTTKNNNSTSSKTAKPE